MEMKKYIFRILSATVLYGTCKGQSTIQSFRYEGS